MMQEIAESEAEELNRTKKQSEQSDLPAEDKTIADDDDYDNFVSN
jgi:hypothetical protein